VLSCVRIHGRAECQRRVTSLSHASDTSLRMDMIKRYADYYAPPEGAFASRASAWLRWDAVAGQPLDPPDLSLPAAEITRDPRKYGFHGTLKPPFRLAEGQDADALQRALAGLAGRLAPVTLPGLRLASLGGFLALV